MYVYIYVKPLTYPHDIIINGWLCNMFVASMLIQ